jgi:hypothetical protein
MKLSTRGWKRDHGAKTLAEKDLNQAKFMDEVDTYYLGQTYLTVKEGLPPSRLRRIPGTEKEIRIDFGADITLNGQFLVRLTLTPTEIARLYYLAFGSESLEKSLAALAKAKSGLESAEAA